MPQPEEYMELPFPLGGIDVSVGYDKQPGGTTPIGQNVRAFEPVSERAVGGARPGLSKYIQDRMNGTHVIQHLDLIVYVDPDALLDSEDFEDGVEDGSGTGRLVRPGGSGRQPSRSRKITPRIKWTTPADITSGTALDATQLNAHIQHPSADPTGSSQLDFNDGTFTYKLASGVVAGTGDINLGVYDPAVGTGQVLGVGRHQPIRVTYTPTELTGTYKSVSKTVYINVTAAALIAITITPTGNGKGFGDPPIVFDGSEGVGWSAGGAYNSGDITHVDLSSPGNTALAPIGGYDIFASNASGPGASLYDITYVTVVNGFNVV